MKDSTPQLYLTSKVVPIRELLGPTDRELVQMPGSTVLHEIAEYAPRGHFVCPIGRFLDFIRIDCFVLAYDIDPVVFSSSSV